MLAVLHIHGHGSIDGTIFFTASYRCSGSGGLDHGCARTSTSTMTDNNANIGCLRCVRVHTASPAGLSDVDARLPQDAGGTRRDLIIGCAMLGA